MEQGVGQSWGECMAHHAEAAAVLCQAPCVLDKQHLSPHHSTKSRVPQGGGAARAVSVCGCGVVCIPCLALPEALPVPVLPSAWQQGHFQLGLPGAGQAPFVCGRAGCTEQMEGCSSPLATV